MNVVRPGVIRFEAFQAGLRSTAGSRWPLTTHHCPLIL